MELVQAAGPPEKNNGNVRVFISSGLGRFKPVSLDKVQYEVDDDDMIQPQAWAYTRPRFSST
jgi:hypothetical protein